jgi:hypothetical protein
MAKPEIQTSAGLFPRRTRGGWRFRLLAFAIPSDCGLRVANSHDGLRRSGV